MSKYPDLFKEELGTLKGMEIKLPVTKDAVPKFKKPYSVPYALRDAVERDLGKFRGHRENKV